MSNLTEFKCPNCGGPLEFDSTVQMMRCPYCQSTYTIEELDAQNVENNANEPISLEWEAETSAWKDEELEAMGNGALRLAVQEGDSEKGCFLAGQCAGMVTKVQPAAEIVKEIVQQAETCLKGAAKWVE